MCTRKVAEALSFGILFKGLRSMRKETGKYVFFSEQYLSTYLNVAYEIAKNIYEREIVILSKTIRETYIEYIYCIAIPVIHTMNIWIR